MLAQIKPQKRKNTLCIVRLLWCRVVTTGALFRQKRIFGDWLNKMKGGKHNDSEGNKD